MSPPSRSALGDVLGRGTQDLVVANLRTAYLLDTDSFVYPGRPGGAGGFEREPIRLPTHAASQLLLADLDGDGRPEILFAGGDQVRIYLERPRRRVPGPIHHDRGARASRPSSGPERSRSRWPTSTVTAAPSCSSRARPTSSAAAPTRWRPSPGRCRCRSSPRSTPPTSTVTAGRSSWRAFTRTRRATTSSRSSSGTAAGPSRTRRTASHGCRSTARWA